MYLKYAVLLTMLFIATCQELKKADETAGNDFAVIAALTTPTIVITSPVSAPFYSTSITIEVSGVESGDTVGLFSDNTCSTQLATSTASGATVSFTRSSLVSGNTYSYYASRINSTGASECSSVVNYALSKCPTNYIEIPGNSTLGTSNFCVMQFEAKGSAGNVTSTAAGAVFVNMTSYSAFNECAALSQSGYNGDFRLMATPEWMTIVRDVTNLSTNWSGTTVGSGHIPRGHSDSDPWGPLNITDTTQPYNQTNNSSSDVAGSGWEQRRTLNLSNGNIIWDFSGNVWEWTDWDSTDGVMTAGPAFTVTTGWIEVSTISGPILSCNFKSLVDTHLRNLSDNGQQVLKVGLFEEELLIEVIFQES